MSKPDSWSGLASWPTAVPRDLLPLSQAYLLKQHTSFVHFFGRFMRGFSWMKSRSVRVKGPFIRYATFNLLGTSGFRCNPMRSDKLTCSGLDVVIDESIMFWLGVS